MIDDVDPQSFSNIRTRITDIEKTYGEIKAILDLRIYNLEDRATKTHEKISVIYAALLGDVENKELGILLRVDRLEQSEKHRKWIWVGIAGLLFNAIWEWIKTK